MKSKKIQPWPWYVKFKQYDGFTHKQSRPVIVDATGKTVSFSNARQAQLAALAPVLLDRLNKLYDQAEMMHMQVQSALAINTPRPKALIEAKEVLDIAGRL